jgi:predicted small metal-binding protein
MSSNNSGVVKVVRCNCGIEVRSANESELIATVQQHAKESHDLNLNDEQVRSMMEIDQ